MEAGEILCEDRFQIADGDLVVGIIIIQVGSLPIGVHNIDGTVEKAGDLCEINVIRLLERGVVHGGNSCVLSPWSRS